MRVGVSAPVFNRTGENRGTSAGWPPKCCGERPAKHKIWILPALSLGERENSRRGVFGRGGGAALAVLHQPRPPRLRPAQPARGRQGRAVLPLLAHGEEPPPRPPRRVR